MKDRGQSENAGFGATQKDRERGHLEVSSPDRNEPAHGQQRDRLPVEKGFVDRSILSNERV